MADKSLRDEAAELVTGAVRKLRDSEVAEALRDLRAEVEKLRAEREAHHCYTFHGYYPTQGAAGGALPLTYTVTNGGTNVSAAPYVTTNAAAGVPATYTLAPSN